MQVLSQVLSRVRLDVTVLQQHVFAYMANLLLDTTPCNREKSYCVVACGTNTCNHSHMCLYADPPRVVSATEIHLRSGMHVNEQTDPDTVTHNTPGTVAQTTGALGRTPAVELLLFG